MGELYHDASDCGSTDKLQTYLTCIEVRHGKTQYMHVTLETIYLNCVGLGHVFF